METQVSPSKIGFRYGIITAIVFIIYGLILQLTGMAANQVLGYLSYLILAVMIYLAHNAFKSSGDGFMKFGQGLSIGMVISAISGVLSGIFTFIYIKYVDDSVLKIAMDQAYDKLEQRGMSDDQIEQAMSMTEKFMTPAMILVFTIIGTLFFGLLISLVVSAITKKDNPQPV